MKIALIGDGIQSLFIALRLYNNKNISNILVFSKTNKTSGSLTSGAMLNSFAEVEHRNFKNYYFKKLLSIYIRATSKWIKFIKLFNYNKKKDLFFEKTGTYVYKDKSQGELEKKNFKAIIYTLKKNRCKFSFTDKKKFIFLKNRNLSNKLLFIKNEKFLNSKQLYDCLKKFLIKKGVKFVKKNISKIDEEKKLLYVNKKKIFFDKIILSCGSDFKKIISKKISQKIIKQFYGFGYTIDIQTNDPILSNNKYCFRSVNRGHACGIYIIPRKKGLMRIGATNQIWDKKKFYPKKKIYLELVNNFKKTFPNINFEIKKINYGFRPTSLDGFPIVGRLYKDIYVASGFGRAGWHCSPDVSDYIITLMFNKNCKNYSEYKYFSPYRKPIKSKNLINSLIDSQYSAYIQHSNNIFCKKKIKSKIKKDILNVLNFHKIYNGFDNQIYSYLSYRKKINKIFNIYEI